MAANTSDMDNEGSEAEGEEEEEDEEKPLSNEELLARYIADNIRGGKSTFKGPFGRKEVHVYVRNYQGGYQLQFRDCFSWSFVTTCTTAAP